MLMASPEEEEKLLWSRGYSMRVPVDVVEPQHARVHELLIRWGTWANSRAARPGLASVEGLYTKAGTPPATAPLSADHQVIACERAVIRMPKLLRDTVRRLYVFRLSPLTVCQYARIRYEAWPRHVAICRSMVVNLLRFAGS